MLVSINNYRHFVININKWSDIEFHKILLQIKQVLDNEDVIVVIKNGSKEICITNRKDKIKQDIYGYRVQYREHALIVEPDIEGLIYISQSSKEIFLNETSQKEADLK